MSFSDVRHWRRMWPLFVICLSVVATIAWAGFLLWLGVTLVHHLL
jgi:hypothetical protein